LKAKMHALELQIKELGTQLESKTNEADHRQRVIEMYKVQKEELNLKLVKLVEDKDQQVQKLSERVDLKFEQVLKAISEIQIPKVVEKVIEKVIEKPGAHSQEGGDNTETHQPQTETTNKPPPKSPPRQSKETPPKKSDPKKSRQQKPSKPPMKGIIINPEEGSSKKKPVETEVPGKGKEKENPEQAIITIPIPEDTSKDEEIAKSLQEEEKRKAKELKEKDERQINASKIRIWPVWTRAKIMQIAFAEPDPYWLHPIASQSLKFDANYQLDMPICPRAFLFKYMEVLPDFKGNEEMLNKILIDFYAKKAKLQQDVWSCTPIKTIPRMRRTNLFGNAFYNWEFDITRGTDMKISTISFADLPLMNPSDWINIYQIMVLKHQDYLKPHIKVFKLMMQNYMFEMGRFDIVAANLMKKTPKQVEPTYCDYGMNSDGLITKDPWGVAVKVTVNDSIKFGHLMMTDIYTLPPNHLLMVKQKVVAQKRNSEHDKKEVLARIAWHEAVRSKILMFHNFMMEHEEKEQ
jgi:hypothetical protein